MALAIQAATSFVTAALPVLLPLVKSEFHLTFAQAGVVANFPFVGSFFTIALAGWAVDRLGDRLVLVLGGALTGVAAIACALAPTFMVLLAMLLIMGAGLGMGTPAGSVAVGAAFPLRLRGMVMGIRQTGNPLGSFAAALILPSIALLAGWRGALSAAGLAAIVVVMVGLWVYRSGARSSVAGGDSGSLLRVLTRDITVAAIGGMLFVAGQMCLLTYLVAYLIHDRGLSITIAAFYLGLAQLTGAVGRVLWGVVSDRFLSGSRKGALLLAGGTGAFGSLVLGIVPNGFPLPLLIVGILLCAIGAVGWNGVQISLLTELARPGSEGRSVGLGLMIQQPGVLLGPFLFGLIVDTTGSFQLAWLLLAGFLVSAMLIISATPRAARLN